MTEIEQAFAAHRAGKLIEADSLYRRVLAANDQNFDALHMLGVVCAQRGKLDEAKQLFLSALSIDPNDPPCHHHFGILLTKLCLYEEAIRSFDRAIVIAPNYAPAYSDRGIALRHLQRFPEALASIDRALMLNPNFAEAHCNRGTVLEKLKRYSEAKLSYDRALAIKPDVEYAEGNRIHSKQQMCDWTDLNAEISHLLAGVRRQKRVCLPFILTSLPSLPSDQLQCAKSFIADQGSFAHIWRGETHRHDRIRLAYLSPDFREHAMSYLMAGVFEMHDKSRFELTALSFKPEEQSDIGRRIRNSFERFVDVSAKSDQETAELALQLEIDIAIDLCGFTEGCRINIFSRRPAPIQVNYLGYPGTLGASYIDYLIADRTVIPQDDFSFYAEKVVWLPDSYLASDNRRRIAERTPTRAECGLPEKAFIYCCFNNSYKIAPDTFEIWARILKSVAGSVLWLLADSPSAADALRKQAKQRGLDEARLVFAQRIPPADHLARHRLADLFLDTLPYGAHTTASDALWAGLPVLTCPGPIFAGRVATSLLHAAGLPEMIASDLQQYEALARQFGQNPSLLSPIKAKLEKNRGTCPLFDTQRFTRHIEAAYTTMWERSQRGEAPASFVVES
jgi:protein O-GlcNAc transferase